MMYHEQCESYPIHTTKIILEFWVTIEIFDCRRQEEEARRRLLENPVRMKQLQQAVSSSLPYICLANLVILLVLR